MTKHERILERRWFDYSKRIDYRIMQTTPRNSQAYKDADSRILYAEIFGFYTTDPAERFTDPLRDENQGP